MVYDPEFHHRQSMRIDGFTYADPGYFFVTICIQAKLSLLGRVDNDRVFLFESGESIQRQWLELPTKFPSITLHEYVIMPNHLHGIIEIIDCRGEPCVRPLSLNDQKDNRPRGTHPGSVGRIIQAFKSITTHEYIRGVQQARWPEFRGRLWQRNYYEHIIRDEKSFDKIRECIATNPERWEQDMENPFHKSVGEFYGWLKSFKDMPAEKLE